MRKDIQTAAGRLARRLFAKNWQLATAESLTGGLFAASLVSIPDISRNFAGGIVCYQDRVKEDLLGVSPELLAQDGAVSFACAEAMLQGLEQQVNADVLIVFTGNAGPKAAVGSAVGEVYIGVKILKQKKVYRFDFKGDREAIREQTVLSGLELLLATMEKRKLQAVLTDPRTLTTIREL